MSWHFNVPEHWKVVPIESVVFFQEGPGVRSHQYTNSGVKLLNGGNINKGILNLDTTDRHISEKEAYEKYEHFLVDDGDLLIACSGVVVDKFDGKIAYAKKEDLPLCMNTSTMRFKSLDNDILHIDYFRRFLATTFFKNQLQKLITGSAQLNFGSSHIKQMKIPLPPLDEQKRIAAILDKADSLCRKRQQAIQLADEFLRAVFLDLFGDPVTNPKGWEVKKLKEISHIQIGPFGTQLHKEDYIENGIPLINPTHIVKGKIVPNIRLTITSEKHAGLEEYHLKTGDIIMGRRGEMGRCAIVTEQESGWFCGTGSLFIRPYKSGIFSEYLYSYLSGGAVKSYLEAESQGVTMSNLNKAIIGNIKTPVPSENTLTKFSIIQANVIKNIKNMKCFSDELLFESLSQKAFAGEL